MSGCHPIYQSSAAQRAPGGLSIRTREKATLVPGQQGCKYRVWQHSQTADPALWSPRLGKGDSLWEMVTRRSCLAKEISLPSSSSTTAPQQQERLLFLGWQLDISLEEPKLCSKGTSQLNLDFMLFTALWLEQWSNLSFVWSMLFLYWLIKRHYPVCSWHYCNSRSDGVVVKNPPASAGDARNVSSILGREDPLQQEMAAHSSILAWRIPWTEEPGGLQSVGS